MFSICSILESRLSSSLVVSSSKFARRESSVPTSKLRESLDIVYNVCLQFYVCLFNVGVHTTRVCLCNASCMEEIFAEHKNYEVVNNSLH